ncbi:hypothetical protein JKF63_05594 [Porcisia hertigi]|uniref:Actin-interacting protein-like protein n=1 Tax=Porcisia hertigi TaxID=2761500 RepID=A0A836ITU9_9TRYP|nr:hypothetical protein JKF63_05594 [Porcisia hertigi]
MRNHRGRSPTPGIANDEVVRATREYSIEAYREIHQRKFKSVNEELDFLRKDFVASRKTLALLHEENNRLERELLARVAEVHELQKTLEDVQRETQQRTPGQSGQADSSGYQRENYAGSERREVRGESAPWFDAGDKTRVCVDTADVDKKDTAPTRTLARTLAPCTTSLSLYAVSGKRKRLAAPVKGTSEGDDPDNADTQQLIRDLRANLARRDTSLNELQMQLSAQQNIRQTLEGDLRRLQDELSEVKKQRDALQAQLTAQEELRAATATQVGGLEARVQQLTNEKEDVQRRLTTAELLYEHASPLSGGGSSSTASGVDGKRAHAQEEALREQLQLYRSKWQAAEDQIEHLHERVSQLQRQLVGGGADVMATAGLQNPVAGEPSSAVHAVIQDAKHTADMAALRRQHQEQLQLHIEEVQRLQRRLERAQENASFHEDQLRQQRQDDARQHHGEVHALQTQLRTAQGELVKAQEDREHLARQLRRSTEQQTTVEVLRSQVDQLKQRLGEVGTELAQVRGREKEISIQAQRERLVHAKLEHDLEAAQEMLEREKVEAHYLREELVLAREQLGMHEATGASMASAARGRPSLSSTVAPGSTDAGGDAAALSSELKGYVGLMRMNTALQRRIDELEGELKRTRSTAPAGEEPEEPSKPSGPLLQQVAHLQAELAKALEDQRSLKESLEKLMKERHQLISDSQVLAKGVELLEKQLRKSRAKRARQANQGDTHSPKKNVQPPAATAGGVPPRGHLDVAEEELQESCHRDLDAHQHESRLRSRLQTARNQDRDVVVQRSDSGDLQQPQPGQKDGNEAVTQNVCPLCHGLRGSSALSVVTACVKRVASTAPCVIVHAAGATRVGNRTGVERRCRPPLLRVELGAEPVPKCKSRTQSKPASPVSKSPPSSPAPLQSSPRELRANETAPPAAKQSRPASAEQPLERTSTSPSRPCQRVYGSILPSVHYPSLVAYGCEALISETPRLHHYSS